MSLVALARQRLAEWEASGTWGGTRTVSVPVNDLGAAPCSAVPRPRERNNGTAVGVRDRPFSGPVFHPLYAPQGGTGRGTLAEHSLPADWRNGLARLATMPAPPSHARRWERIVGDALMLGDTWAPLAFALGWRDVDLWGCDPDGSRRLDRDGLAMLLDGRTLLAMTETAATIATPGGRMLSNYRNPLNEAVSLWQLPPG